MLVAFLPEGFGLVLIALWLYCIFDVISTDESLARNLPKTLWLVIVIFLPDVGSIAWLLLGRPLYAGWRPGDTTVRQPRVARGPEDSPSWSPPPAAAAPPLPPTTDPTRLQAWEDDLIRRERELRATSPEPQPEDPPAEPFRW